MAAAGPTAGETAARAVGVADEAVAGRDAPVEAGSSAVEAVAEVADPERLLGWPWRLAELR